MADLQPIETTADPRHRYGGDSVLDSVLPHDIKALAQALIRWLITVPLLCHQVVDIPSIYYNMMIA